MGRNRVRLKVLTYTFMCFAGMSLLVILHGLDKLVDPESEENPYSTWKRPSLAAAPGDRNTASISKVVLRDDNVMQIDLWINYSSVLPAKKLIREEYGSTHRKPPVSNGEGRIDKQKSIHNYLHDLSRTHMTKAVLKNVSDRIQNNVTLNQMPSSDMSEEDTDEEHQGSDPVSRRDLPHSQMDKALLKSLDRNQKNFSTNLSPLTEDDKIPDKGSKISERRGDIKVRQQMAEEKAIHDNDYVAYVQETNYSISQKPLMIHARTKIMAKGSAAYRPQFVILLAQMRTGSSVVGQILNQNKDIFYLYEPLHVTHDWVAKYRTKAEVNRRMAKVLSNISQCEFSKGFVKSHGSWGGRTKSRALMPLCKDIKTCRELPPTVYKQICLAYNGNVAVKLIRSNLLNLKPLLDEDLVDVRIIQLVRDPRGTANSRLEYFSAKKDEIPPGLKRNSLDPERFDEGMSLPPKDMLKLTTQTFCSWLRRSLQIVLSQPAWLRGRYLLIRYEDFADRPQETAQEIYSFLGRPTPPEVLKWIEENTQGKTSGRNMNGETHNHSLFSMSKNSSIAASRWRLNLSREQVMTVQDECENSMRLLGYQIVGEHTPLNMLKVLSVSLIKELGLKFP